uniref:Uncharacterized protein n=1 Tax=Opuntia streptacantha TaxID=393608 RepID=A0A7C9DWA6_OPUST
MLAIVVLDDEGTRYVGLFGVEIEGSGAAEVLWKTFQEWRQRIVIEVVVVRGGSMAGLPERIGIAAFFAVIVDDDGGVDVGRFHRSAGSGRPPSSPRREIHR